MSKKISAQKKAKFTNSNRKDLDDRLQVYSAKFLRRDRRVRNFFWNYPLHLLKFLDVTRPFSFIFFYIFLAFQLFNWVISIEAKEIFMAESQDKVTEATIGALTNLNPVFITQNTVDRDLQTLVFQKFIDLDSHGKPVPEIAEKWVRSKDGKVYDFYLRKDIFFSNGERLTAEDVVYTFEKAMQLSENKGYNTIGAALINPAEDTRVGVEAINKWRVRFTLPEENATFYEALSVYIVSKKYFKDFGDDKIEYLNTKDKLIGSGPYKIVDINMDRIFLEASEYYKPEPKIPNFEYRFYSSYEPLKVAYQNNQIDVVSNIGKNKEDLLSLGSNIERLSTTLPYRKRILYFNLRLDKFKHPSLRKGLSYITDKEKILKNSKVKGNVIKGPVPEFSWAFNPDVDYYDFDPKKAVTPFFDAGYVKSKESGFYQDSKGTILSLKLAYLENEVNTSLAEELKKNWEEQGVVLKLDPKEYDEMVKEVIANRDFELLLYQVETTIDPDQYELWHSLKSDYPWLNLAGYDFVRVDIMLEEARQSNNRKIRKEKYFDFQKYLMNEPPVIFLFNSEYEYFVSKNLNGVSLEGVRYPYERLKNVQDWEFIR